MLRDAALLQLELLRAALAEDMIPKDASPYNVQWQGTRPVFIDVGSFEALREGEPWAGYRQFCCLFLYPLMVQAYAGLPFQPWLRGSLEGIEPAAGTRHPSRTPHLPPRRLRARRAPRAPRAPRGAIATPGPRCARRLSQGADRRQRRAASSGSCEGSIGSSPGTAWSDYGERAHYEADELERKDRFVREACASRERELAWDLGCNDGRYSRIAAEHARLRRRGRRRPRDGRRALPKPPRRRRRADPAARHGPRRPVACAWLARARAQPARGPRQAGPRLVPGPAPPPLDRRERSAAPGRRLAGEPRRHAGRRVRATATIRW